VLIDCPFPLKRLSTIVLDNLSLLKFASREKAVDNNKFVYYNRPTMKMTYVFEQQQQISPPHGCFALA
jgi:hypothetical protein